jgi:ribonuclease VapC
VIVVDTSALMAIILGEGEADACIAILESEAEVLISAGTVAEAMIVAARRNVAEEMSSIIDGLGFDVVTVTPASARRIAKAYDRWGKGIHPAGLNFGDCFAYEIASEYSCPLLFVGDDFSRTDLASVLGSTTARS